MKLLQNKYFLCLLWILMVKPGMISQQYAELSTIWNIVKVLFLIYVWIVYLFQFRKISVWMLACGVFCFYTVAVDLLHGVSINQDFVNTVNILSVVAIMEMTLDVCPKRALKVITGVITVNLLINLATIALFPGGMYHFSLYDTNYYMGYDNCLTMYVLPVLTCVFLYSWMEYKKQSKLTVAIIVLCAVEVCCTHVMTAVITVAVFVMMYALQWWVNKRYQISFTVLAGYVINVIFFISIVVVQIGNIFAVFLNAMGKGVTFNSRTFIWNSAMELILKQPVFGYGDVDLPFLYIGPEESYTVVVAHAHNMYLSQAYHGGLIEVALFFVLLYLIYRRMKASEKDNIYTILSIGCFVILLASQMENMFLLYYFIVFTAAYHIEMLNGTELEGFLLDFGKRRRAGRRRSR